MDNLAVPIPDNEWVDGRRRITGPQVSAILVYSLVFTPVGFLKPFFRQELSIFGLMMKISINSTFFYVYLMYLLVC